MSLPRNQPARLERYLHEQVERMRRALTGKAALSETNVHRARVASRRLKAALDVIEPLTDAGPLRKLARAARKVRKSLGALRELDVMLGQLPASAPAAIEELRETLKSERTKLAGKLHGKVGRWREAASIDKHASPALKEVRPAVLALLRERLLAQLDAFCEQADVALHRDGTSGIHALRITAKRLRYLLEIAGEVGLPSARSSAEEFERVQDSLGAWHDEAVFAQHITAFAGGESILARSSGDSIRLLELASDRLRRAGEALERFESSWRDARARLPETIRGIADASINRSTADRDRPKKR